jgi:hypothetical protein
VKTPLEPGGKVSNIPGLNTKNKVVVTMRSVLVRTRPIAFAIIEYTRKNTSAWNKTAVRPGETVTELDAGAIGSEDDTWAKREEEGGWDGNFLGSDIWKHVYIISYYNSMALSSEKR